VQAARCAANAIRMRSGCEFSTLCFGEHKFVANESTNKCAEMNLFHLMSVNIKFDRHACFKMIAIVSAVIEKIMPGVSRALSTRMSIAGDD
jgi:hypothetical protein